MRDVNSTDVDYIYSELKKDPNLPAFITDAQIRESATLIAEYNRNRLGKVGSNPDFEVDQYMNYLDSRENAKKN